jgi:hypothetical protein
VGVRRYTKSAGSTDSAYSLHAEQAILRQNLTVAAFRRPVLLQFVQSQDMSGLRDFWAESHFFIETAGKFRGIGQAGGVAT